MSKYKPGDKFSIEIERECPDHYYKIKGARWVLHEEILDQIQRIEEVKLRKEPNNTNELTTEEIWLMCHCIGLDYRVPYKINGKDYYKTYRNYCVAHVYEHVWNGLVGKGFAKHGNVDDETQYTTFWLTRNGLDALGDAIGAYIYDKEE